MSGSTEPIVPSRDGRDRMLKKEGKKTWSTEGPIVCVSLDNSMRGWASIKDLREVEGDM